jgi:hypothetical protein
MMWRVEANVAASEQNRQHDDVVDVGGRERRDGSGGGLSGGHERSTVATAGILDPVSRADRRDVPSERIALMPVASV